MEHRRIILCLDGTWNNPYQMKARDDGTTVLRPSNPLKIARAVLPVGSQNPVQQITYYDTGVGALNSYPGLSNKIVRWVDSKFGGAWGAGFEGNIEQALTFLVDNYQAGDEVYLFGFSRGAAQARGLTRFIDWMGGIPCKQDAYFVPLLFHRYLTSRAQADPASVTTAGGSGPSSPMMPVSITLLGVFDTVMALGARFKSDQKTTGEEYAFHVGDTPAACVQHARQALAIDERRFDFRPEIWKSTSRVPDTTQTLEQRWFAGVHSNIGGGYIKDGLANLPLKWLLAEAQTLGLEVDRDYLKHYRGYPQDQLFDSYTWFYSLFETVRRRKGKGERLLLGHPDSANLSLDPSVIHRWNADPEKHKRLEAPYRPDNLARYLDEHPSVLGQVD